MVTSSTSSTSRLALAAAVLLAACGAQTPSAKKATAEYSFTCPAEVSGHKFLRPSIYNGEPGKQEYELAPDDEKQSAGNMIRQTWNLADYRDMNLFVRCRYDGTNETREKNLPLPLKTCVFAFRNVKGNQPVASPNFGCK